MGLAAGTLLGPYEIQAPLGAGGMGEVYRARDTRLERTVAIKILPEGMSRDLLRRQRFEREAKAISSLNHPHICVLHDVGSQDGLSYLVMECVEGETLAKRLEKGPLPLEQVLTYGAQIADALDKAHRSGVVHRDLKPGNIMLTPTGAKLLDFGLAKPAVTLTSAATLTVTTPGSPVTQEGTIVGTFQYMSPEQVEGKELDGRSDIFSLGTVLYEMVTGQRAFEGKSQLSVASAILEKEPAPISSIKPLTPLSLDHLIRRCMAKEADRRWQSAADLARELEWISESGSQASVTARPAAFAKARGAVGWIVSVVLLVFLIAGVIWSRNAKLPVRPLYFHDPFPFEAHDLAISPNGSMIAVIAYSESERKNLLYAHELGSAEAKWFGETEGARFPFWSPDGKAIGFFADGKLKRLELPGGQVQTICDAPFGRGGTWNQDGVIVFTPNGVSVEGLYRVAASGGAATRLTTPDRGRGENNHRWPVFLPDGKHFLYLATGWSGRKGVDAIFVGSLDSNEKQFVAEASSNAVYAAPGYLLFYRDKALMAQRFDLKSFTVGGELTTIVPDLQPLSTIKRAPVGVSKDDMLVALTRTGSALSQLTWFDRKGKQLGVVGKPGVFTDVSLAPNGAAVAVEDDSGQNTNIWAYDLRNGGAKRITFDPADHAVPIWSPDGTRLVFASFREIVDDLYVKNSDGSQDEKAILRDETEKLPNDWSRDGRHILFSRGLDLWSLSLPDLKSTLFLKAPYMIGNGQFSPDGKWVAYASNETGKWQIYVTSFPDAKGKWQVSTEGGEQPRWRGDGKELFYLSSDGKIMAAPVNLSTTFDAGRPGVLFQCSPRQLVSSTDLYSYDVSRDGQRFLINMQVRPEERSPITVVLNWSAKLNK